MSSIVKKDLKGLRCPVPSLKVNHMLVTNEVKPGEILEVTGDCPSFEADIKKLCSNWKKQLLKVQTEGAVKIISIKI